MKKKTREAEPEHYSWELGIPDNATRTEVIVDPYKTPVDSYVYEEDWKGDYPEDVREYLPDRDTSHAEKYYGTGVDPYESSFRVGIDDKEVVLPTKDISGKDIDESEAINRYIDSGVHLGETKTTPLYEKPLMRESEKVAYDAKIRQLMGRSK
jgi:hypothetical protein